jgi:predicted dehydrogenase
VAQPPAWGQKFFLDGNLSGGALLDLHIHDTDFVQFCFGRPRGVFSSGFCKLESETFCLKIKRPIHVSLSSNGEIILPKPPSTFGVVCNWPIRREQP